MNTLLKSISYVVSVLLVIVAVGLAFVAIPWFDNKALIVRSGSMEPTIKVGDLVVVNSKGEGLLLYKEGDIVAFKGEKDPKILTTHRIVAVETKEGKLFYQTKGDANNAPDNGVVAEEKVVGKAIFLLPYIGRLFAFTKSNIGFPLLVIFPALLVIVLEVVNIFKEIRRQRGKSQGSFSPSVSLNSLVILIPLIISGSFIQNSHAFFSNSGSSTNNIFTAGQFPSINDIVINEVYYRIAQAHRIGSEADSEWAELYNPTSTAVSLANWSISDNTSCDNMPNASIPSNGFAIVSTHTEAEFRAVWTAVPTDGSVVFIVAPSSIGNGLANNDELALRSGVCPSSGLIVDHISWGSNTNGLNPSIPAATSAGISHERDPDGIDTNTNADFVNRDPPTPGI
ncbi:signal peptidase I [Candidatus Microgenomates bacterium]|nr:signal peptidase I [Candidatus Microgenomates bacterium]